MPKQKQEFEFSKGDKEFFRDSCKMCRCKIWPTDDCYEQKPNEYHICLDCAAKKGLVW